MEGWKIGDMRAQTPFFQSSIPPSLRDKSHSPLERAPRLGQRLDLPNTQHVSPFLTGPQKMF
jgi:hypothetical protein